MSFWEIFLLSTGGITFLAWGYLLLFRGFFWWPVTIDSSSAEISSANSSDEKISWPAIDIVVPARNEAETLPVTLPRLLNLNYPGRVRVFIVDDHSEDNTSAICQKALKDKKTHSLFLVTPESLPEGWTGKVWAMKAGLDHSRAQDNPADWVLFTDADISYSDDSLKKLVTHTLAGSYKLGSWMVRLRVDSFWDRLLIPAFVYFFAKLFPFRWAADPNRKLAAAAGGCILVESEALRAAGGLESIRSEIIDDCSLANRIKNHSVKGSRSRIWLGLVEDVWSIRAYGTLEPTWQMVARTAFTQLNYSYILLALTVLGMCLIYLAPPILTIGSFLIAVIQPEGWTWISSTLFVLGSGAWGFMSWTYLPTLAFYRVHWAYSLLLPVSAAMYNLMSLDSGWKTFWKKGGQWKGRHYTPGS